MPGRKATPYDCSYVTPPTEVRFTEISDPDFHSIPDNPIVVPKRKSDSRMGINKLFVYVLGCNPAAGECDMAIFCSADIPLTNPEAAWCSTALSHQAMPGMLVLDPAPPGNYQVRLVE